MSPVRSSATAPAVPGGRVVPVRRRLAATMSWNRAETSDASGTVPEQIRDKRDPVSIGNRKHLDADDVVVSVAIHVERRG